MLLTAGASQGTGSAWHLWQRPAAAAMMAMEAAAVTMAMAAAVMASLMAAIDLRVIQSLIKRREQVSSTMLRLQGQRKGME